MKEAIAILTGGGPAPGMNTVVGSVAKTFLRKGYRVIGLHEGYTGLFNPSPRTVDIDYPMADGIFNQGGSFLQMSRFKPTDADFENNFNLKFFTDNNIKLLVTVGGDDTASTANRIAKFLEAKKYPIANIHVPKTIDNDLVLTDHTPGFGSAAKYVASTVREIVLDASVYQQRSVTIVEIMGRHAGWLTAASRLARKYEGDNPCLIYLPETPFSLEQFYNDLDAAFKKSPNLVVCVSEGIADEGGTFVCEYSDAAKLDSFGHKMLTGCGEVLESFVRDKFGVKVRSIELNVNQRCSGMMVSETDIEEAAMAGAAGVKAVLAGETKKMIAFKRDSDMPYKMHCTPEDVSLICNQEKKFPKEWINAAGNDITDDFSAYALPLIQGEPKRVMENGVPKYLYRK